MLSGLDEALKAVDKNLPPMSFEIEWAKEVLSDLAPALDRLLDSIEEHAHELPQAPDLRRAIRDVCEATGRGGSLGLMV